MVKLRMRRYLPGGRGRGVCGDHQGEGRHPHQLQRPGARGGAARVAGALQQDLGRDRLRGAESREQRPVSDDQRRDHAQPDPGGVRGEGGVELPGRRGLSPGRGQQSG